MIHKKSRLAGFLLAFVVAIAGGFAMPAQAANPAQAPAAAQSVQADCGDTSGFERVSLGSLPREATDTYNLIRSNGPYPYPQDNTVFQNRERLLPICAASYYREYTVKTPGSSTRGARRIVKGNGGEFFYTADHYASFKLINVTA